MNLKYTTEKISDKEKENKECEYYLERIKLIKNKVFEKLNEPLNDEIFNIKKSSFLKE